MNQIIDDFIKRYFDRITQTEHHSGAQGYNTKNLDEIDVITDRIFQDENSVTVNIHHPAFNRGPRHKHNFFELIYVYRGSCNNHIYSARRVDFKMLEGDICILNPNAVHRLEIGEENRDVVFNIMFKTSLFDKSFINLIPDNSIMAQFFINSLYNKKDKNEYLLFQHQRESGVPEIVESILTEHIQQKICYQNTIQAYLIVLFSALIRQFSQNEQSVEEGRFVPTDIAEILDYIAQNYSTVTLKSAAEHFFYNPSYLSTYIKRFTNQNFSDIVLGYKLDQCCNYLRNSELSTSEIIQITGFNYGSHFFKLFKKHMHCTPSEYRALHQVKKSPGASAEA